MQTGQVGNSVDPIGGVVAISIELVYSAEPKKRTWQTSPCKIDQKNSTVQNPILKNEGRNV